MSTTANPVHLLDVVERATLRKIERACVIRSGLAGALSGLAAAAAEAMVVEHQQSNPVYFWVVVGVVAGLAAVAELWFVSWDALRTVHAMSEAAGVYADERVPRSAILTALARAALEVPNPRTSELGIDPHKETRKSLLLAAALVYKLKVSATNIALKFFVRRALSRVAMRTYIVPFVAVPVTAAWNAAVTAIVLREARVRIFGPSLAHDVVDRLVATPVAPQVAEAMLRAVGSCVVRTADLHPNLEMLLALLRDKLAVTMPSDVESSQQFLARLAALENGEARALVLRTLRAAAVIDGRVARREKQLLVEAGAWHDHDVEAERRRVVAGEQLLLR